MNSSRVLLIAVLTDAGRQKLEAAWPHFSRSVDQHFASHLKASEARQLTTALTKLLDAHGRNGFDAPAGCE